MKFRAEFLKKKRDDEWVAQKYLNDDVGAPTFEVVFYNEADGKWYAFEYYEDGDSGIDTFEGALDGDTYECYEVVKKEVVQTSWVKAK